MASSAGSEVRALGSSEGTLGALPGARPPLRSHHLHTTTTTTAGSPGSLMVESVDDAEGLYVAVERCPLCNTARRRLTCARCIQAGDFVYFDGRNPERYTKKLERLQMLKEEKELLEQRVITAMDKKVQADQLKWKMMSCKMKIEQLKEAIGCGNEEEESQRLQRRASRHQEKRDKIERHNQRLGELLEKRGKELQGRLEHLAEGPSGQCDQALTSSTVSELAEARRTTYLSGRWIWDDQNGETSISITGPRVTLPSNGDCSPYYSWLDHINPAHTISAALCYATQLINILSHILDVNLPKKLCNSEFCGDSLSRYRFTRAVTKLNTNILHLCFSQAAGQAEESGDEMVTDEETDLGTDWETVPSPRFCDIPSQPMDLSQSMAMQVSQPVGQAGGMISSAAASVTS
ncbi:unnamed protein product, partial [Coregonus sp. 'balchen']